MNFDSKTVGQNISRLRKLNDIKAATLAMQIGMKEAAYTKYERGETAITLEFVQRVAEVLKINPAWLLTSNFNDAFYNIQELPISIKDQTHIPEGGQTVQEEKLNQQLESIVEMSKTLVAILEKKISKP
jgi:transcriptional regulator with XRE-family HTH domain